MRNRHTFTKATRPKGANRGRPLGAKDKRPRLCLSKPSIREAYELVFDAHPELMPQLILDGLNGRLKQKQMRQAYPLIAMGSRVLDAPPDRNVNLNANLYSEVDIKAQIGLLTDAELHQFASMLERVGVKPGELTMDDGKPALPALVGDGKKGN